MGKTVGDIGNGTLGFMTNGLMGNSDMGISGALTRDSGVSRALGLSGEQGEYFQPTTANAGLDQLNLENQALTGSKYQDNIRDMSNGTTSLEDGMKDLKGAQREGALTDGVVGSRYAAQEVQNNPLTSNLFGKGGLNDRLGTEEQDLASRGYGLQQQDHEAYGQAAGDIARQFGQQEQDTSASLARRGLGGGSSGAAGAAFSGIQGNKNEMLAKAQTDIAQKRMADTTQRLQATRGMMSQLGNQGAALQDDQYNRQLSGAKNRQQNVTNAAQLQSSANASNNAAGMASMEDKRKSKGKTLWEGFGQGLYGSSQQIGGIPGQVASSYAGAASGGGGGGGMMASDERNKQNVTDGSDEIEGFLDSLGSNKYEYTPDAKGLAGAGEGDHYSPMAQELEQTPVGASMVQDTPDGKQVDYGKGFGALASGLGELNGRLKRLEGRA